MLQNQLTNNVAETFISNKFYLQKHRPWMKAVVSGSTLNYQIRPVNWPAEFNDWLLDQTCRVVFFKEEHTLG